MANSSVEAKPVEDWQGDGRWMSLHNYFLREAKEKEPEVLLIGDSICMNMSHSRVWKQMFEPLHCLNFGMGADCTEHVLWRVKNGELDEIKPKVIVLMVGTNNHGDTANQVADGILAIVKAIQERQPSSHVIVMGLLPRGEHPNPLREKHEAANKILADELSNRPMTIFLKIDEKEFMTSDGIIERDIMYDFLHLTSEKGYQIVCEPLLEEIQNLLGTFVKVESTSFDTGSTGGDLEENNQE